VDNIRPHNEGRMQASSCPGLVHRYTTVRATFRHCSGPQDCDVLVAREGHGLIGEATQHVLDCFITARHYSPRQRDR
jgi:hypothetical protein